MAQSKSQAKQRRHERVRKRVQGTAVRPRLTVFKSLKHISAQIIDDSTGRTLIAASTTEKVLFDGLKHGGNIEAAQKVGESLAERAAGKNIQQVVFDRGGNRYHGCVRALAEAARAKGLSF